MGRVLTLAVMCFLIPLLSISASASTWYNDSFLSRVEFNLTHATTDMNYTFQKLNLTIDYQLGERWVRNSTNTSVPFNITRNGTDWHEIVFKIDHTLPAGTKELYYIYRNSSADSNDTNPYTDIIRLCLADVPDTDTLPFPCFSETTSGLDIFNEQIRVTSIDGRFSVNFWNVFSGTFLFRFDNITGFAAGTFGDGTNHWFVTAYDVTWEITDGAPNAYLNTNGTAFDYVDQENIALSFSFDTVADLMNLTMNRESGSWYFNYSIPPYSGAPVNVSRYSTGGHPINATFDEMVMLSDNSILMAVAYLSVTKGQEEAPFVPTDTCTAPGTGDWEVEASDFCIWDSPQDVPGDLICRGTGRVQLSDFFSFTGSGQEIAVNTGCTFEIKSGGGFG